jgi:hypothetical protein
LVQINETCILFPALTANASRGVRGQQRHSDAGQEGSYASHELSSGFFYLGMG